MEVRGYRVYYISKNMEPVEIVDMVRSSRAEKIALVIHNEQEIIADNDGLKLLNNFITGSDKEIVIITPDERIAKELARKGFTVYNHLEALERSEEVQASPTSNSILKTRFLYFTGMFITLILAAIYFLYPTVTIEIKPVTQTINEEISLKGTLKTSTMDWEKEIIPIHEFEVTLTDKEISSTTGKKILGITRSQGKVRFINENKEKVTIPAGTIVQTPTGLKFKTLKQVEVPPLKVDYLMDVPVGMKAGQAEVKIESLSKGNKTNVKTGLINQWEQSKDKVYVINPEPTIGGKDEKRAIVSQKDINKMKAELEEKIRDKLINKVYKKLGGNYRVIEDEIQYTNINYEFNGKTGDTIKQLEGKGTIKASGLLLRNNELDKIANHLIKDSLIDKYHLITHGFNVNTVELEKVQDEMYNIKLGLNVQVIPKIKTQHLAEELAGKTLGKADNILANNKNINNYKIHNKQDVLPGLKYAIKIVVNQPQSYPVMRINQ